MNCKHCNAELPENSRFCPACGEKVETEETVLTAPEAEEITEPAAEITETEETAETAEAAETAETASQEEAPAEETKKPGKIVAAVVAIVVVLALLIALIVNGLGGKENTDPDAVQPTGEPAETVEATVPADGNPDDVTCKGSYTVSDEELLAAADTVVAAMGDRELTVRQLQVYYWTEVVYFLQDYSAYASYLGIDYTKPLDTQICAMTETPMTWQQYFLGCALDSWASYQAMTLEAEATGCEMSEDIAAELEGLPATMEQNALMYGMSGADEMVRSNFGAAATVESYMDFWNLYYKGYAYYNSQYESMIPTAEEVEAYFAENEATYAENSVTRDGGKYVNVRHILLFPEGGTTNEETGETTYSDEEWEACRAAAQALLDEWKAGEATEDSFAQMANTHSEDGGSNTNGGLYENVYKGQMVPNFEAWCFDETRVTGDTGLVRTEYGYHIMYYVENNDIWFVTAETDLLNERLSSIVPTAVEKHPIEADFSAMKLGLISLT